jgi:hypothetical protein
LYYQTHIFLKERSFNEKDCLNNNTVDEFPNDDNLLSEIDLKNFSEVSEVIERYESDNTKQHSSIPRLSYRIFHLFSCTRHRFNFVDICWLGITVFA